MTLSTGDDVCSDHFPCFDTERAAIVARLEGQSLFFRVWQPVAVLGLVVGVHTQAKQSPDLLLIYVVSEEPIVELIVLPVEIRVGEDARLQQVVDEVLPLL